MSHSEGLRNQIGIQEILIIIIYTSSTSKYTNGENWSIIINCGRGHINSMVVVSWIMSHGLDKYMVLQGNLTSVQESFSYRSRNIEVTKTCQGRTHSMGYLQGTYLPTKIYCDSVWEINFVFRFRKFYMMLDLSIYLTFYDWMCKYL